MSEAIREDTAPRIFFDEAVTISMTEREEPLHGRALNLSSGGIYICAPEQLARGQRVSLHFCLPDGDPVTAAAIVMRSVSPRDAVEPAGMALSFEQLEADYAERIDRFIQHRTQPAAGETVRLQLGELGAAIKAKTQSYWERYLAVDAELPFLRLGSAVSFQFASPETPGGNGTIRWVSIQVPAGTGVPRLNIGIELAEDASLVEVEEDTDPVCNSEFVDHSSELDKKVRAESRGSSRQANVS